jgi:hypothetical protein
MSQPPCIGRTDRAEYLTGARQGNNPAGALIAARPRARGRGGGAARELSSESRAADEAWLNVASDATKRASRLLAGDAEARHDEISWATLVYMRFETANPTDLESCNLCDALRHLFDIES